MLRRPVAVRIAPRAVSVIARYFDVADSGISIGDPVAGNAIRAVRPEICSKV
jgi:hypothetical protein